MLCPCVFATSRCLNGRDEYFSDDSISNLTRNSSESSEDCASFDHGSDSADSRCPSPMEADQSDASHASNMAIDASDSADEVSIADEDVEHYHEAEPAAIDPEDIVDNDPFIMFEASGLSTNDVMEMITAYCVRFCLPYTAREALVEMVECLAGPRNEHREMSKYHFRKKYDPPADVITYTFFCTTCKLPVLGPVNKKEFKKQFITCEECQLQQELSMQSANRFVYIDLKYQFKELLNTETIRQHLMGNLAVRNDALDAGELTSIRDIYDGQLYKDTIRRHLRNAEDVILTYNINTDGMPIFNSSKRSAWPLLLILNELPPNLRFKHVILAGLWVGDKEPSTTMMNTFLQQFVVQANSLTETGLTLRHAMGVETTYKLVPLCCTADSVARPIVQSRLQYNGYHGCSWCYAHGKYVRGAVRYLFEEADANLRTHESHRNDVEQATELEKPTNGVKGISILLQLLLFNMVWGFPFEYMHAILLGVIKLLWEIWTTRESPIYLSPAQRIEINRRILKMTPVHEVQRLPRPLSEKCKWKASEWLSWLLFYSLPCLNAIIPDAALKHLSLLVESTFVLLQHNISAEELNKCEMDLVKFVAEFEILYGAEFVTFNVHSLLHVVESVKMTGPLWATSAFSFEGTNYHLKRQVNGPKGVDDQIAMRYLQKSTLLWKLSEYIGNEEPSKKFCTNLFTSPQSDSFTRTVENAVLLGKGQFAVNDDVDVIKHERCVFEGVLFHSAGYRPEKKTNDSIVQLMSNEIVQITGFFNIDNRCYVDVRKLNIHSVFHVSHIFQIRNYSDAVRRVPITEIQAKVMVLEVDQTTYICQIPHIGD